MDRAYFSCALTLSCLLAASITAPSARATEVLNDNTYTPLPGTSVAARPELAGTIIYSDTVGYYTNLGQVEPRSLPDVENGYLHSWIVRENATGTLDYYYQAVSVSTGDSGPTGIVLTLPPSPALDLDFIQGLAPALPVSYVFLQDSSLFTQVYGSALFIHTNQTTFDPTPFGEATILFVHELSGTGAIGLPVVVPGIPAGSSTPVPEPSSLALLPIGCAALFLVRRSPLQLR